MRARIGAAVMALFPARHVVVTVHVVLAAIFAVGTYTLLANHSDRLATLAVGTLAFLNGCMALWARRLPEQPWGDWHPVERDRFADYTCTLMLICATGFLLVAIVVRHDQIELALILVALAVGYYLLLEWERRARGKGLRPPRPSLDEPDRSAPGHDDA